MVSLSWSRKKAEAPDGDTGVGSFASSPQGKHLMLVSDVLCGSPLVSVTGALSGIVFRRVPKRLSIGKVGWSSTSGVTGTVRSSILSQV